MQKENKGLNKQAVSLLVCIISAFALWFYVSYVENPNMTRWVRNIPVTIEGESKLNEKGLAVHDFPISKIDLKLRANRSDFSHLSAETITATVDVSKINSKGQATLDVKFDYPSSATDVETVDKRKTNITFTVEDYVKQHFSIEPNIIQNPGDGYFKKEAYIEGGDMQLEVAGSATNISKVHKITTNDVDLSNVTDDVILPLTFTPVDVEGNIVEDVKIESKSASVTFVIYKSADVPVELSLRADNPDLGYTLSPEFVSITGPAKLVESLEKISTEGTNEYSYKVGDEVTRKLFLPENISLSSKESAEVNVKFINERNED